jgi:hypothetical protein
LQALQTNSLLELKSLLNQYSLVPFTLNGFPQGDFHSQVVKHRVYLPTWWQTERRDYTLNLVRILDGLLAEGEVGSISTLPIAWSQPEPTEAQLFQASSNLMDVANQLHQLFESSGRKIVLAIEPEPGCYLTDSESFRRFFNRYLSEPHLTASQSLIAHEYLTLCHDICHAAVMFEDQANELDLLRKDGIGIGKVQVSSAIEVDWQSKDEQEKKLALAQLNGFAEDRYLHQTNMQPRLCEPPILVEDLGKALASVKESTELTGRWRIHFHVPIFLEHFGLLSSTQSEIEKTIALLISSESIAPRFTGHFEIETYAWGVLPSSLRQMDLVDGIAAELVWFQDKSSKQNPSN